jgi:hypothetical protein
MRREEQSAKSADQLFDDYSVRFIATFFSPRTFARGEGGAQRRMRGAVGTDNDRNFPGFFLKTSL